MAGFLKVIGIISMIISIILVILLLPAYGLIAVFSGFFGIVAGLALIALADTMHRVDFLQEKLHLYMTQEPQEDLPQKTCIKCQQDYDFDYPKCPFCGCSNEL